MSLDLRYLRPKLNDLLLGDRCDIFRDPEGFSDDTVDPATGSIIVSGGDITLVYNDAPCSVRHILRSVESVEELGVPTITGQYIVKLAGGDYNVNPGDLITVVSSVHEPEMVGQWFRLVERLYGSLAIFTKFRAELRERPSDR